MYVHVVIDMHLSTIQHTIREEVVHHLSSDILDNAHLYSVMVDKYPSFKYLSILVYWEEYKMFFKTDAYMNTILNLLCYITLQRNCIG